MQASQARPLDAGQQAAQCSSRCKGVHAYWLFFGAPALTRDLSAAKAQQPPPSRCAASSGSAWLCATRWFCLKAVPRCLPQLLRLWAAGLCACSTAGLHCAPLPSYGSSSCALHVLCKPSATNLTSLTLLQFYLLEFWHLPDVHLCWFASCGRYTLSHLSLNNALLWLCLSTMKSV